MKKQLNSHIFTVSTRRFPNFRDKLKAIATYKGVSMAHELNNMVEARYQKLPKEAKNG